MERNTFLSLSDQKFKEIIKQHQHLQGINMNDYDVKPDLVIYMIYGAGGYGRISVQEIARARLPRKPVAELTQFRWILFLQGMRQF